MQRAPETFRNALIERLPNLWRFALSLCRGTQDPEDLLQATCERALSRWKQLAPGSRMESWLFAIMHSIWKNELRRDSRRKRLYADLSAAAASVDGESASVAKVHLSQVLTALTRISADQAAALTLVHLEGLSYREAAEALQIPQGTLESRIARGRIALGRMLEARIAEPAADSTVDVRTRGGS